MAARHKGDCRLVQAITGGLRSAADQAVQRAADEQALEALRQQLQQARQREGELDVELQQGRRLCDLHRQETQIWELLLCTITEGCWDITVVNGDVQDPRSQMRIFNQFRLLLGYIRSRRCCISTGNKTLQALRRAAPERGQKGTATVN
ncbi:hypothetical protein [Pseudomonas orientalis]|uniref:Uncharacterized protein n=1 Tax=Pseudomonas orientalis TaxID=76758 RepID=A0A0R3A4A5_9PSED|nr:hypothetical protein [Pseudomonas orientalis]AZE89243.1 hypothetical protein C4J97_2542 [Pseudomonas orientalis]KRP67021.1 hypothetical protein TU82_07895 [Pseudomonas orientalis]SDT92587.1 hypothetical protein SAMN04490197_0988 [Pseudomonas orientalis]